MKADEQLCDDMEVADEVLQEVDVYLNKAISPDLHIFQYWSQSSPIAEQTSTDIEVKVRPNHRVFEIETEMDTRSKNFDRRKSESFGRNCETDSRSEPQRNELTKRVLKSTEMKPILNQYCVAVVSRQSSQPELHLNPIRSVIQFRPQLNYLNNKTLEVSSTKANTSAKGDDSDVEVSGQENGDIQAITMRFAGPDEDKLRKAREKSFAYLQQNLEKDQWVAVHCHPVGSQVSNHMKDSLVYKTKKGNKRKTN